MSSMATMARLEFGRLSEAWLGEAADFTPLLAEQLDAVGAAISVDLVETGRAEVPTTGGRRIDILAEADDGSEFVIENQYGRGDHDHLTRGLAYAVARRARGLVVVAEEHRDEFRAVAQYLNEMAELDAERGIFVWLVEAKAVRIGDSSWAPLFSAVVEPNQFTARVEQVKQSTRLASLDAFFAQFESPAALEAARRVIERWEPVGRRRLGTNHVVLEAAGPSVNGFRSVVTIYSDGRVMVPFMSYGGTNTGIPIAPLTSAEFRQRADALFGFRGSEKLATTTVGWLQPQVADALFDFCVSVADAYRVALADGQTAEPTTDEIAALAGG
jgi:hypothetical protein